MISKRSHWHRHVRFAVIAAAGATLWACVAGSSQATIQDHRTTVDTPAVRAQTAGSPGVQSSGSPGVQTDLPAAAQPVVPTSLPTLLIDCATSASSAQTISDLKVPYYPWFGQSTDPGSMKTGKINVALLVDAIGKRMGENPTGWGMLDYEEPFDAWLDLPVTDPRNRAASAEMVRAIRAVKKVYPNVRWTYYGQPRLARNLPDAKGELKVWQLCPPASKQAEIERRIASCSDILREVDWINPSLYDVYENARFEPLQRDAMIINENIWRTEVTRLGRTIRQRLDLPQIPVIPCISFFFQPGGLATNMKPIGMDELLADQVDPALAAGADSFAVWTSMDFFQMLATLPPNPALEKMNVDNQKDARDAWTAAFFSGRRPSDWTDPEVRFKISQETGKVISAGVKAVDARVKQQRAKSGPH